MVVAVTGGIATAKSLTNTDSLHLARLMLSIRHEAGRSPAAPEE